MRSFTATSREEPWTQTLWIYDLRTNKHYTLKTSPLKYEDLQDFIDSYNPQNRHQRQVTERFHVYTYEQLVQCDKANLDVFWLRDETLEDTQSLPLSDVVAKAIAENLQNPWNNSALYKKAWLEPHLPPLRQVTQSPPHM